MGSNRELIGKEYKPDTWNVTAEETEAYADATSDANPAYRGDNAIAPPLFAVVHSLLLSPSTGKRHDWVEAHRARCGIYTEEHTGEERDTEYGKRCPSRSRRGYCWVDPGEEVNRCESDSKSEQPTRRGDQE